MTDKSNIVAIVEGHGEVAAFPGLMRRILQERLCRYDANILKPIRANGKPALLKRLEKLLGYAILKNCDAILVLVDADNECPSEQAIDLAKKAGALNLNIPVAIVYARSEYETWFIGSLYQDKGKRIRERLGISECVRSPHNVEDIRDAKNWLTSRMPGDRAYKETEDQEPLTHHIDLELAYSRSRSFRRLCHAVEELVHAIDNQAPAVTPSIR